MWRTRINVEGRYLVCFSFYRSSCLTKEEKHVSQVFVDFAVISWVKTKMFQISLMSRWQVLGFQVRRVPPGVLMWSRVLMEVKALSLSPAEPYLSSRQADSDICLTFFSLWWSSFTTNIDLIRLSISMAMHTTKNTPERRLEQNRFPVILLSGSIIPRGREECYYSPGFARMIQNFFPLLAYCVTFLRPKNCLNWH